MMNRNKYLKKELIIDLLTSGDSLREIFKADSIIFMDDFVRDVYDLYRQGFSEEEILNKLLK